MPNLKKENKKRVAIYARVSTDDKGQNPETQLMQLREYADLRGFEVVEEFFDYASGTTENRENYQRLSEAVRRRKVDIVLVWRYDRFARSVRALINALNEFRALGVDFISFQENIDTSTPQGEMVFTIMASLAQFESSLISQRVKAGMERAKKQGKRISRPRISETTQTEIKELWKKNTPIRRISRDLEVPFSTVQGYVDLFKKQTV